MKMRPAALALALAAAPAAAQVRGEVFTLEEAVSVAVRNSPAVLAAEQDILIARQRVSEARFLALPQFTLSGTLSMMELEYPAVLPSDLGGSFIDPAAGDSFYSVRAQALQPIYTGGKNTNTLKLAKTAYNQAKVNFEAARASAALSAKKAFYTFLYQRKLGESAAYWLERASRLSASVRKDPFEELEAGMLVSSLEEGARLAYEGEQAAHSALLKALNREPEFRADARGDFRPLPVPAEPSGSLVTAMETRPELRSELYKAQMDDIAVNMAMVRRNPTVYLGASYDLGSYKLSSLASEPGRSGSWLAFAGIRFPLSYDIWTQVQQRRAQQRQGELKRAELQDGIRFEILSSHREAAAKHEDSVRLSEELERMKGSYEAASASSRPSMPALRALRALYELDRKRLDAVYAQLLARIRLEWARGRDLEK